MQTNSFPTPRYSQELTCLFLIVLSTLAVWQTPARIVQGQTSSDVRFTQSLKWQEVEPGIEYGQTTSGRASKDELTGPWFINALRIDLKRASLKIVHALDEGVGLETVSSLAARYQAPCDNTDWMRAYSMLGGGPQLIKSGKIAITDKQEKMTPGFATDQHPRTAIANAKLESGKLLLVTVDGRQCRYDSRNAGRGPARVWLG